MAEMVPHTHWGLAPEHRARPDVAGRRVPGVEKLSLQTGRPGLGVCRAWGRCSGDQGGRGLVVWEPPPDWKLNCSHFFVAGSREKDIFVGKSNIAGLGA